MQRTIAFVRCIWLCSLDATESWAWLGSADLAHKPVAASNMQMGYEQAKYPQQLNAATRWTLTGTAMQGPVADKHGLAFVMTSLPLFVQMELTLERGSAALLRTLLDLN